MSSPATTTYVVTYNLFSEKAALARAVTVCGEWQKRLKDIAGDVAEFEVVFGVGAGVEVRSIDLSVAEGMLSDLRFDRLTGEEAQGVRAAVEERSARLDQVIRDARAEWARVYADLERATTEVRRDRVLTSLATSVGAAGGTTAPEPVEGKDDTATTIGRILARLDGATPEERDAAESIAKMAIEAPRGKQQALVVELRGRVQRTMESVRVRAKQKSEAAELRERLRGLEGPDVNNAHNELAAVLSGDAELSRELVTRAERVERDGRRAADTTYAAAVVSEALEALGYELDVGFSTLLVGKGQANFHRPAWGDLWIRLRVDPERSELNFNTVYRGSGTSEDASDVEGRWCAELPDLLKRLGEEGINATATRLVTPGTVPVERDATTMKPSGTAAADDIRPAPAPKRRDRVRRRSK